MFHQLWKEQKPGSSFSYLQKDLQEGNGYRHQLLMEIVSWYVRGLGNRSKRAIVKEVIRSFHTDIILIQESKLNSLKDSIIKEIWGRAVLIGAVVMQLVRLGEFWLFGTAAYFLLGSVGLAISQCLQFWQMTHPKSPGWLRRCMVPPIEACGIHFGGSWILFEVTRMVPGA